MNTMASRKILFLYPSNEISFPLQIAALSAYVKSKGHQSKMLSLVIPTKVEEKHLNDVKTTIEEYKPDLVGFSAYETAFPWIEILCKYVKQNWPHITTIVGGYYTTLAPEEAIKSPNIDVICRGEGELPLEELLSSNGKNTSIQNLWFKKEGKIIRNPIRPLMEDLDALPYPDRDLFDYQKHLNNEPFGERNIKVMATRGCPYQCTYCSNYFLKAVFPNKEKYLRFRSPENVINEIVELKGKYKFEKVGFHDDNLTLDTEWLKKFVSLYKEKVKLPFYCATRVERCTDEIIDLLKDAGCYLILLGIESGNEKYRKEMMKRFMSNQQVIDAFKKIKKRKILTWSFVMVGLPNETKKMVLETFLLNFKCNPDFVMASIFFPLKGTELGDLCYKNGWVNEEKKKYVNSYAWETVLNHPYLSPMEIKIAKYLNSFSAIRSGFFWKLAIDKVFRKYFSPKH
jgi:anaerobic magnesium-protoporphyrin IX monomethyl ester cyclase